jgi:hypothetical protein
MHAVWSGQLALSATKARTDALHLRASHGRGKKSLKGPFVLSVRKTQQPSTAEGWTTHQALKDNCLKPHDLYPDVAVSDWFQLSYSTAPTETSTEQRTSVQKMPPAPRPIIRCIWFAVLALREPPLLTVLRRTICASVETPLVQLGSVDTFFCSFHHHDQRGKMWDNKVHPPMG